MKWGLAVLLVVVALLHQDFWNWTDKSLVFGILPVGLAYHAAYSCVAALTMLALVKFAWPHHLEDPESAGEGASH
jgi:hypothetical protein